MVRTRDTAGVKVGAKAPRKGLSGPSTSSSASSSSSSGKKQREDGGGNPVCPRETPAWQKPITDFFRQASCKTDDHVGSSDAKENVKPEEDNVQDVTSVEGAELIENKAGKSSETK